MIIFDFARERNRSAEDKFWARYFDVLADRKIPWRFRDYYHQHAERFALSGDVRLADRGSGDVRSYFEAMGRDLENPGWIIAQAVEAVEILYVELVGGDWVAEFDWEALASEFEELAKGHPTLGRSALSMDDDVGEVRWEGPPMAGDSPAVLGLIERLKEEVRLRGLAIRTENTYVDWCRRFLRFSLVRDARGGGASVEVDVGADVGAACSGGEDAMKWWDADSSDEVTREGFSAATRDYLRFLTLRREVAPSTHKQAFNALIFMGRHVLGVDTEGALEELERPKKRQNLPAVISKREAMALIDEMCGAHRLMAELMFGAGLRLAECMRLRVKDVDLELGRLEVRDGKGGKDRMVPLPKGCFDAVLVQVQLVREFRERDREADVPGVYLPGALARKYPNAATELAWQWLFPSGRLSQDPRSGLVRRHHVSERGIQRALKKAVRTMGLPKKVSCHTLRHSFATTLLLRGSDIRTIQELMGHADVRTTMRYTHVVGTPGVATTSPLDD